MNQKLKIYMGYYGNHPEDGACLVFAKNVREARNLSFSILDSWFGVECYIDVKAVLLKNEDYLYKEADQEKLNNEIAHVVESPESCSSCELWGRSELVDGKCEYCRDDEAYEVKE
jgi:hypothetical protein